MSYLEFSNKVREKLKKYDLTDTEITTEFNRKENQKFMRDAYESITGKNLGNQSPESVAYCLWMMM